MGLISAFKILKTWGFKAASKHLYRNSLKPVVKFTAKHPGKAAAIGVGLAGVTGGSIFAYKKYFSGNGEKEAKKTAVPCDSLQTNPADSIKIRKNKVVPVDSVATTAPKDTTKVQPVDTTKIQPVDTTKVQPADTTKVQPVDTTKVQPKDTTKIQPVDTTKVQPVDTTKIQPVDTTKIAPVDTTKAAPAEDKVAENDKTEEVEKTEKTEKTEEVEKTEKAEEAEKTEKAQENNNTTEADKLRKIADELREIADSLDNAKAAPAEDKVDEKEVVKDEVEKKDDVEKKDEVENKDDVEKKDEVENKDDVENKDKVEEEDKPEAEAEQNDYTVVKGDCVWNIAKADLTKKLGRKPTNAEILKRTDEIMELNKEVSDEDKEAGFVKLEWAEDHYHVMIHPGDKIKLAAPEKKILLTA